MKVELWGRNGKVVINVCIYIPHSRNQGHILRSHLSLIMGQLNSTTRARGTRRADPRSTLRRNQYFHQKCTRRYRSDKFGYIYVFEIPAPEGFHRFKVGRTNNYKRRRREWTMQCFPVRQRWWAWKCATPFATSHGQFY
jgi:hypothetical protein